METKTENFIQLIEKALKIAEQMRTDFTNSERLNNVISGLESIKNQTLTGQLEPSGGRTTLGLSHEVADWVDSLDSPLLKAVGAVEEFYQHNF